MRDNWNIFDENTPKEKEVKVFAEYRNQMRFFLQNVKNPSFRVFKRKSIIFNGTYLTNYWKPERTLSTPRYWTHCRVCKM